MSGPGRDDAMTGVQPGADRVGIGNVSGVQAYR